MIRIKYLTTITILLFILVSCKEKHNVIAQLEGMNNDTIFIAYATIPDFYNATSPTWDTLYAKNGKFTYDIPSQEPYFAYFYPKESEFPRLNGQPFRTKQNTIVTFVEPEDRITIRGKLHKYYVDYEAQGSEFNEEYSRLRTDYIKQSSKGVELELIIDSLSNNNGSQEKINALFKERNRFNRLSEKSEEKYVNNNPKRNISAFFLTGQNPQVFDNYYSGLPSNVKNGVFKLGLEATIDKFNKLEKINEANSNVIVGTSAPNFILRSIDKKNIELNSLNKEFIVLDFWGTWCPPCIKGFPKMKEYYSKYKDKVEFVGIACNDKEDKWREAVSQYGLDWIQLFNSTELNNDVSIKYGIKSYPTKIIIDKEKNIVGIFAGETDEFYNQLDELLN